MLCMLAAYMLGSARKGDTIYYSLDDRKGQAWALCLLYPLFTGLCRGPRAQLNDCTESSSIHI